MHLSVFSSRGRAAGFQGELTKINPNPRELNGTPRHRIGKLDIESGSSKLNYDCSSLITEKDHLIGAN